MLAELADPKAHERTLGKAQLVFEPKYDGIRALIDVQVAPSIQVAIYSRLGNDKSDQFPELIAPLERFARRLDGPLLLDGEVVAVDARGQPLGFQHLQGRFHVRGLKSHRGSQAASVAFIAFDLLRDGDDDVRGLPFHERRARLVDHFRRPGSRALRLIDSTVGGGNALRKKAERSGWEGIVAKDPKGRYATGRRQCKLAEAEVRRDRGARRRRMDRTSPVACAFRGLAPWLLPERSAVPEGVDLRRPGRVWIQPGRARPGRRPTRATDYRCQSVYRVSAKRQGRSLGRTETGRTDQVHRVDARRAAEKPGLSRTADGQGPDHDTPHQPTARFGNAHHSGSRREPQPARGRGAGRRRTWPRCLEDLERRQRRGTLVLSNGQRLPVGNLDKVFWPDLGITKGELVRFYVRMAPYLLPVVDDRPLVMKRFPNGVTGKSFYQHRAPDPIPDGLRVAMVRERPDNDEDESGVPYLVGGELQALLYMAQLAVISQDPWFSRLSAITDADQVALDLDPMPGASFQQVLDVACWLHDELRELGTPCFPKTSGSKGIHIFIPLPPGDVIRSRHDLLSDSGHARGQPAPRGGDRGAHGQEATTRHGLHRLSAKHLRQDVGLRLQCPGQFFRGRVDASHVDRGP